MKRGPVNGVGTAGPGDRQVLDRLLQRFAIAVGNHPPVGVQFNRPAVARGPLALQEVLFYQLQEKQLKIYLMIILKILYKT